MASNWAIVVGINEYEHLLSEDHLKYAVRDAVKVQEFLCQQAQFSQDNVLLCCDSAPGASPMQRPSRSGLRDLLLNKIERASGADNFWFFYAGHGMVHEHQDFLLPCDGNPNDLRETAIPISFVTDCLRDCGAHNVVLVLDMCRNCTTDSYEGSRNIGQVIGEKTLEIARERGIVTLFSCSRGQRSYEIKDLEQGAFTYALLEGLKRSTTPRVLEQYLTTQLPALSNQYGKPMQMPMVIPEPGWKYDLPLLLSCATPADIAQLRELAKDAELDREYERAEGFWWQVIQADQATSSDRAMAKRALDRIAVARASKTIRLPQPQPARPFAISLPFPNDALSVEHFEVNYYTKLRDFLKAQRWKEANQETELVMLQIAGCEKEGWLDSSAMDCFPMTDLRTIDQLWLKYSDEHFGFTIQQRIFQQVNQQEREFMQKVDWTNASLNGGTFLEENHLNFSLEAPEGHLPMVFGGEHGWIFSAL